jgi:hypothetical protein
MSDKVKPQAQEMSRDQLVRANFEAYRDLQWAKNLEPKFEQYDLNAEGIRHFRKEWNAHTEENDWAWWQKRVKNESDGKLKAEIAECLAEIKAIEACRPVLGPIEAVGRAFLKILNGDNGQPLAEPTQTEIRTRER